MVGQIIITRPVESYVSFDRGNRVGICFSFLFFFLYFLHAANRCEISPKINIDNRSNDYAATRFPADFSHFCTDSAPVSRMWRETGSKRNRSFLQDNAVFVIWNAVQLSRRLAVESIHTHRRLNVVLDITTIPIKWNIARSGSVQSARKERKKKWEIQGDTR